MEARGGDKAARNGFAANQDVFSVVRDDQPDWAGEPAPAAVVVALRTGFLSQAARHPDLRQALRAPAPATRTGSFNQQDERQFDRPTGFGGPRHRGRAEAMFARLQGRRRLLPERGGSGSE